jgi:hypothetical protein
LSPTDHDDLVAKIEELKGESKADAGRASGDENGAAGEFHMNPFGRSISGQSNALLAFASSFPISHTDRITLIILWSQKKYQKLRKR